MRQLVERLCSGILNHPDKQFLQSYYEAGAYLENGEPEKAIAKLIPALRRVPTDPDAYVMLAAALEAKQASQQAKHAFEQALLHAPESAWVQHTYALFEFRHKFHDQARRRMSNAIQLEPREKAHRTNYAVMLEEMGFAKDAETELRSVLEWTPDDEDVLNALSINLVAQGRYDEAVKLGRKAVKKDPNRPNFKGNLAIALTFLGNFKESEELANQSLKAVRDINIYGDHTQWLFSRSQARLAQKKFGSGWADYRKTRMAVATRGRYRHNPDLPFRDEINPKGKKIVVFTEQGLGDEIVFAPVLEDIARDADEVLAAVEPRLVRLFEKCFRNIQFTPIEAKINQTTVEFCLSSDLLNDFSPDEAYLIGDVFAHYRSNISSFENKSARLGCDDCERDNWKKRIGVFGSKPKIGICWRSGLVSGSRKKYYAPLKRWCALLNKYDFDVFNLQYDDAIPEITAAKNRYGLHINAFNKDEIDLKQDIAANAALCASLDLVISAQTAAGTIAGAVGTETWFIAPSQPWTSFGVKDRLPMFGDNVRCFWSEHYADWDQVFARLEQELDKKFPNARKTDA